MSNRYAFRVLLIAVLFPVQIALGQITDGTGALRFPAPPVSEPNAAPMASTMQPTPAKTPGLSLQQAVFMALQHSDVVNVLDGGVRTAPYTVYDAEIAGSRVYGAEGKFDPQLDLSYEGSQINRPPNSFFGPGIQERTRRDEGTFRAAIEKQFAFGTTVSAAYDPSLGYLFLPEGVDPGEYNPSYTAVFGVGVRHPLLRGAGFNITTASLRIAKAKKEQADWEFEESVNAQIRSVCEAYWNLYAAYQRLSAVESVLPLARESCRIEKLRFEAERTIYADLARAEVQLEELIRQRIRAWTAIRTRTFELNQLIGVSAVESGPVEPTDKPLDAEMKFDLPTLHTTAVYRSPELLGMRRRLDAQSIEVEVACDNIRPELELRADYWTNGLSDRLDDALDQSASLDYTSWTLGVNFSVPLGNRSAKGQAQEEQLRLVRNQVELRKAEERVRFEINDLIAQIESSWERYQSSVRQQQQATKWLKVSRFRYSNPPEAGADRNWLLLALSDYQTAMQASIDAVSEAAELLAEYNTLLARLDEIQGVSRDRWQVDMTDEQQANADPESMIQTTSAVMPSGPAEGFGHTLPAESAAQTDKQPLVNSPASLPAQQPLQEQEFPPLRLHAVPRNRSRQPAVTGPPTGSSWGHTTTGRYNSYRSLR